MIFENRDTVLMQIQEMIRTERISRPAGIEHELETYNELVPGNEELSCTMMIDVIDKAERDAFLRAVLGIQQHVALVIDGERIGARCPRKDDSGDERAVAVLYLKFSIPARAAQSLRAANAHATLPVELAIDHPNYAARVRLPRSTVAELAKDLDA